MAYNSEHPEYYRTAFRHGDIRVVRMDDAKVSYVLRADELLGEIRNGYPRYMATRYRDGAIDSFDSDRDWDRVDAMEFVSYDSRDYDDEDFDDRREHVLHREGRNATEQADYQRR